MLSCCVTGPITHFRQCVLHIFLISNTHANIDWKKCVMETGLYSKLILYISLYFIYIYIYLERNPLTGSIKSEKNTPFAIKLGSNHDRASSSQINSPFLTRDHFAATWETLLITMNIMKTRFWWESAKCTNC